jgi:hypothetical protein
MIRAFLARLFFHAHLEFEPASTNWQAWRDAVGAWRRSREQQLRDQALSAIARRQA